jgi:hypothetical protein
MAPAPGVTASRAEEPAHKFLSDALVARGHVTQRAMDAALLASRSGRRYIDILVINGELADDDLARTLADHHRIDHVDLDVFAIDAEIQALVPRDIARRLGALPVALLPTGEVAVAVYNPEALTTVGEVAKLVGREVRPVVAARSQVERHIDRLTSTGRPALEPPSAPPPAPPAPPAPAAAAGPSASSDRAHADPAAAGGDHIARERSRIAERALALARFRDEMAPAARTPAPAPGPAAQAPVAATVAVAPDASSPAAAAAVHALEQRLAAAERRAHEAEVRASASALLVETLCGELAVERAELRKLASGLSRAGPQLAAAPAPAPLARRGSDSIERRARRVISALRRS